MLGELYYIFCKYSEQLAEKYGYDECYLKLNSDGSGSILGFVNTIVTSGCPPIWSRVTAVGFISWDTLLEGVKLLRKEVMETLESGGKKWS